MHTARVCSLFAPQKVSTDGCVARLMVALHPLLTPLHCLCLQPLVAVTEIIRADYDAIQAAIEVDDAAAAGVSRSTVEAAVNARRVAHGNIAARADAGGGSVANIHAPKSSAHAHDYDLALNARFAAGRLVGSSFVNTVFAQVTMRVMRWEGSVG